MVGGGDQDGIDIFSMQHAPVIVISSHFTSPIFGGRFKLALGDVAKGDDGAVLVRDEPAHIIGAAGAHADAR